MGEEKDLQAIFDKKIEDEIKIEPKDWMPDDYRKNLIRQMAQHAHSEVVGMLPEGNWITRAPSLRRKVALLAKMPQVGRGLCICDFGDLCGASLAPFVGLAHSRGQERGTTTP